MTADRAWIGADEAARLLHVSRTTLYAYVSRGHVRSQATAGPSRQRLYSRDDVERLRRRTEARRDPDKAAARSLQWGLPVLESSIAFIDGRRLYYRGHDAVALSRSRSIAEVASLIWSGRFDDAFSPVPPHLAAATVTRGAPGPKGRTRPTGDKALRFVARAQAVLASASSRDHAAFALRAGSVPHTGWRILDLMTRSATIAHMSSPTVDQALGQAWGLTERGVDLLRSALILCADHELNVSSFTARCVASAGSHPYAVVIAGLAALEGTKHGGISARIESMLDDLRRSRDPRAAVGARLRRGESIDGFGHPLYRDGDPRAIALLDMLHSGYPKSRELAFVLDVVGAAAALTRERPNLDFALVALARVLRLPAGSALTIFAIGRTIGWIGHAIEQYATNQLIRPRAKYVGIVPQAPSENHK
jgi:citrate synthase